MKVIYFTFLMFLTLHFQLQVQGDEPNTDKIPLFIGRGYNLVKGNPYTPKIDDGFTATIFDFTYTKGSKTEDGAYLIPDNTHSTKSISCSLDAKCQKFSGTEKYVESLNHTTKVDTRISGLFVKASFSLSRTFTEFSSQTVSNNRTLTQTNAECSIYVIDMPIYSSQIKLLQDFQEAVRQHTKSGGWEDFLNHFGSHFASKVTFGGRYVYEHSYDAHSVSLFESMGIDITIASKVQFANRFSISMSDQLKKYQNKTNIANTKVISTTASMIGGQPQKGGTWVDWSRTVQKNLAPIDYELTGITALFGFISNLNTTKAVNDYNNFLAEYCKNHKCPPLHPDRPNPKPLAISFKKTQEIHGSSMNQHPYNTFSDHIRVGMRVTRILMGTAALIDSVQFFLSDGLTELALPIAGNRNFNKQYKVPTGDEIKCVRFGIKNEGNYWKFCTMTYLLRSGKQSEEFKGTTPPVMYKTLCMANSEDHFVGYYGHIGIGFDSVGINYMTQHFTG